MRKIAHARNMHAHCRMMSPKERDLRERTLLLYETAEFVRFSTESETSMHQNLFGTCNYIRDIHGGRYLQDFEIGNRAKEIDMLQFQVDSGLESPWC